MSPERQDNLKRDNVVLGMAAAMGAFFMFSLMVLFAKLLSENHSVIEIAFYRNLIGTLPFLFVIFALGRRDIMQLHTKPVLVISRAVIGTASLIITFFAFSLMPLAQTTALLFASSLFIPVLAVLAMSTYWESSSLSAPLCCTRSCRLFFAISADLKVRKR